MPFKYTWKDKYYMILKKKTEDNKLYSEALISEPTDTGNHRHQLLIDWQEVYGT